jgi:hypothetical protein
MRNTLSLPITRTIFYYRNSPNPLSNVFERDAAGNPCESCIMYGLGFLSDRNCAKYMPSFQPIYCT